MTWLDQLEDTEVESDGLSFSAAAIDEDDEVDGEDWDDDDDWDDDEDLGDE